MLSKGRLGILLSSILFATLSIGCPGGGKVKSGAGGNPTPPGARVVSLRGCIKGRVVKEDGSGFPLVKVMTEPTTNFVITSRSGFFKICYKIQEGPDGEPINMTIPPGKYVIKFSKEGYHARPVTINFTGEDVKIPDVLMVEKTQPLPEVVESEQEEEKRPSGATGKAPKSE